MILGLIALMDNQYRIRSNRESDDGRYDVSLIPRDRRYPGIIMELKMEKGLDEEGLDALSTLALKQIDGRRYYMEMKDEGVQTIIRLGIAFSGKKVRIAKCM